MLRVARAAPQGRAAGAAPIKRGRRQVARGSAARGKYEDRSTSMRCALDVYRLREGARLLAERWARSPGSARVCAREIRTSKDVINLAPQQPGRHRIEPRPGRGASTDLPATTGSNYACSDIGFRHI